MYQPKLPSEAYELGHDVAMKHYAGDFSVPRDLIEYYGRGYDDGYHELKEAVAAAVAALEAGVTQWQ